MTPEEELAEMRRQYRYATLENNILVDGVIRMRCRICRKKPLPTNVASVLWCDSCIDEYLQSKERMEQFIERKHLE